MIPEERALFETQRRTMILLGLHPDVAENVIREVLMAHAQWPERFPLNKCVRMAHSRGLTIARGTRSVVC